jgi:leader peptidase (prepilin peptidase)/N-methyltransferase
MTGMQNAAAALAVGAVGAAVGSFVNVVLHRLPAGRSLWRPPSCCPACGGRIAPFDNVPVLAWLWLRGRCRGCRASIPARYPAVEAACGLVAAAVYLGASLRAGGDLLESPGAPLGLALRVALALLAATAGWLAIETRRPGVARAAGWFAALPSLLVVAWAVAGR